MKSCLKVSSLPGSPDPSNGNGGCRKCVAFNAEGSEEVHWADEWDRTPTEPAKKLSYQELLELKEIQQSLPHAPQPADLLRPGKQLLSMVPIGLLPLVSAETSASPVSPPPQSPEFAVAAPPAPTFVMPPGRARGPPTPPRMASASLTHLRPPAPPAAARQARLRVPPPPPILPVPPTYHQRRLTPYLHHLHRHERESDERRVPDRVLPSFSPAASRPRPIPIAGTAHQQPHPVGGYERAYRAAEAAAYSPALWLERVRLQARPARHGRGPGCAKGRCDGRAQYKWREDDDDDDEDEEVDVSGPPALTLPPPAKEEPSIKTHMETKPSEPPIPSASPLTSLSLSALAISASPPSQTSPRLAVGTGAGAAARPLSPSNARPSSPLAPLAPLATAAAAGRLSPVQARASSRLVRV
ncbi:hypothetical protein MVEN_01566600 [Mycena venus]|uniref:Uncharacterized protein n=1 Tax=Mycena venus TaxID=2733690 RepID=A0A8H6XQX1_9AGAR|nr:hypothetical protein MVEN_01566600 [Mycena venus]